MKVTLVKPKIGHSESGHYAEKAVMEPLNLGLIAALTPPDIEVVMYDDRIEEIPFDEATDLVAITVHTFTAKRAYEISAQYRKRGVKVILGGIHPSLMPDEASAHADSVCIGNAESAWPGIIEDAKHGRLARSYTPGTRNPMRKLFPRRDIFEGKHYLPVSLVRFTSGCSFNCDFCCVHRFYDRQFTHRAIDDVIEEIVKQKRKFILFTDDNISMNAGLAKELFRALIPLKIRWISEASITIANDPEMLGLMVESGCVGFLLGFESINEKSLKTMNKLQNLKASDGYVKELAMLRSFGIEIWAAFTMGHDNDTTETVERTLEFAIEQKFMIADFNVLLPYPNTSLYERLASERRLLFDGRWWLHPRYRFGNAAFLPSLISASELEDACRIARRRFYAAGSILRRAMDLKTNMQSWFVFKLFVMANYLHRHDTVNKQDIALGTGSFEPAGIM